MVRLIRPVDHRIQKWRNGRGETAEIAVAPDDGTGRFRWRLSRASVPESGPFSDFAGYDRTLVLLTGDGLELAVAGAAPRRLLVAGDMLSFPGDARTDCRLLGGPCSDLNVMTDRARCRHQVALLRGGSFTPAAPLAFAYVIAGSAEAGGITASAGDTLVLDAPLAIAVSGLGAVAEIFSYT